MKYKVKVNEGFSVYHQGNKYDPEDIFIFDGDAKGKECLTIIEEVQEEAIEEEPIEEVQEETIEEESIEEVVEEKKTKGKGGKKGTIQKPVPPPQK